MAELKGFKVAVVMTDGFEQSEFTGPVRALRDEGADVQVISLETGQVQGFKHHDRADRFNANARVADAASEEFDALFLPGGALNADVLRAEEDVIRFVRDFSESGKPIAAICHAPWVLVSAGLVKGRRLTAYHTIQDDIRNAGGEFLDQEVVVDGNLVTSRQPSDIPAFNREMFRVFKQYREGTSTTEAA